MASTGTPLPASTHPLYRETQRPRQWWLWVVVAGVTGLAWWAFIQQIIVGRPFGSNPSPDWGVWLLWAFIGLGLPCLFLIMGLVLEVAPDRIMIRLRPFRTRIIPLVEVQELQARKYSPVKEYGGWGIKGWSRKNIAYNMSGDEGVELTLHDGRRVMLGSQRAAELAQVIEMARSRASST